MMQNRQHMPSKSSKGTGSHNARLKGVPAEVIGVTVLKLHEIWQIEGKRRSDPDS